MASTIRLIPDELVIEQVDKSPFWRMRWKEEGTWKAKSTKLREQVEAESFARQQFAEIKIMNKHGLNQKPKLVRDVTTLVYQQYTDGPTKPIFTTYKTVIRKYIDPIAGNWPIAKISNEKFTEYEAEVAKRIGVIPSKGTINQHNSVWREIFRVARDKRWCTAEDMPRITLIGKGRDVQSRPAFSLDEYKQFRRFLRTYHEKGSGYLSKYKRKLLREYCEFLFATGMRPGKEPSLLKWKHIKKSGRNIVLDIPDGKTGSRQVVAMHLIKSSIERLKAITKKTGPEDFVFCLPDGTQIPSTTVMVSTAMKDAGLKFDNLGVQRTAYSLRHTYATFNIQYRGLSFSDLATNMGTSVLMIETHYSHVRSGDIADKLASGRDRRTRIDSTMDKIRSLIELNFPTDMHEFIRKQLQNQNTQFKIIWMLAAAVEMKKWQKANPDQKLGKRAKEVYKAADTRVHKFLDGEKIF